MGIGYHLSNCSHGSRSSHVNRSRIRGNSIWSSRRTPELLGNTLEASADEVLASMLLEHSGRCDHNTGFIHALSFISTRCTRSTHVSPSAIIIRSALGHGCSWLPADPPFLYSNHQSSSFNSLLIWQGSCQRLVTFLEVNAAARHSDSSLKPPKSRILSLRP